MKETTPLDINEVVTEAENTEIRNPYSSLIELIPISLITLALGMRYLDMEYWPICLALGAGLAVICYLFLSWYMFKVERYILLEVLLSVLFGLLFTTGIIGVFFKISSWQGSSELIISTMYGAGGMTITTFILFILNFRNERASIFYRTLLSRLLVLTAILYRMYFDF